MGRFRTAARHDGVNAFRGLSGCLTRMLVARVLVAGVLASAGLVIAAATAAPVWAQAGKAKKSINIPNFTVKGRAIAVEGDLLSVNGTPVRIMGIDAPDPGQKCKTRYGQEYDCFAIATGVLRALVGDDPVECTVADKDRNGQNEGECRVRGFDLGSAMVARGWAFAYRSLTETYAQSEAYAQSHRFGMWAGHVERPWQWRSRRLREQAK